MANQKSVVLDLKTARMLFMEIQAIERSLAEIKNKIFRLLPAKYGSELWWEKGHIEAEEDIQAGRVYELKSVSDLDRIAKKALPE